MFLHAVCLYSIFEIKFLVLRFLSLSFFFYMYIYIYVFRFLVYRLASAVTLIKNKL